MFFAAVTQPPECRIDRVVRHRAVAGTQGWEKIPPSPGEGLELPKNGERLARERHDVRLPHLHASSRDTPFRVRQVKLGPLGGAQFTRTDKHERSELQCQGSYRVPSVAIDRAHELANAYWIEDRGEVLGLYRRQRVLEIRCHIVLGAPRRYCIAQHSARQGPDSVCGLVLASRFDPPQRSEQLLGR
ncbi:MAG TPA: hypothetical protein VMT66_05900 [Steroidobacteraceae bacterium]|nr:hypothetical protein [Steroidobacteraceae bacterium]